MLLEMSVSPGTSAFASGAVQGAETDRLLEMSVSPGGSACESGAVEGSEADQFLSEARRLLARPASSSEDPWANWKPGAWENEWEEVQIEKEYVFDIASEAKKRGLVESELFFHVFEYGIQEGLKRCYSWQAAFDAAMLRF